MKEILKVLTKNFIGMRFDTSDDIRSQSLYHVIHFEKHNGIIKIPYFRGEEFIKFHVKLGSLFDGSRPLSNLRDIPEECINGKCYYMYDIVVYFSAYPIHYKIGEINFLKKILVVNE